MKTQYYPGSAKPYFLIVLLFMFIPLLFLSSCSSEKRFTLLNTNPEILPEKVTGTMAIVHMSNKKDHTIRGELIAVTNEEIMVYSHGELIRIASQSCSHIKLLISKAVNHRGVLTAWAAILPFSTIIHGTLLVLTFPLNVIITVPVIGVIHTNYKTSYPDRISMEELAKFARFPQGLPEGFSAYSLKPGNK
ncbi:MAG: hypothetical protein ABIQ74_06500 [Chitinophagales bacterium]